MNDREEILQAYRLHHQWMVEANIEKLQESLAPEFYLRHMSGLQQTKEEWLKEIATGGMNYIASEEEQVEIEVFGRTAILIGRNRVEAVIHGNHGTWNLQLKMPMEKVADKWVISHAIASMYEGKKKE